jgi:sulfatase modifying factor 1
MNKNMEMMGVLALFISVAISGCAVSEGYKNNAENKSEFSPIKQKKSNQLSISEKTTLQEVLNIIQPKNNVENKENEILDNVTIDTKDFVKGNEATNSIGMKLIWIPANEFDMGSSESETDEKPIHRVRISKGFWIGSTEVTQGQYKAIMEDEPWSGEKYVQVSDLNPAVYVSWENAVEFCRRLSQKENRIYRLPTEAEWEYACRANSETRFSFGDNEKYLGEYAWYQDNTWEIDQKYARQVGQKYPNAFGLYDMHGNAWEWCSDWYDEKFYSESQKTDPQGPGSGRFRVIRGGSWHFTPWRCRSAARSGQLPYVKFMSFGFRVVLEDF